MWHTAHWKSIGEKEATEKKGEQAEAVMKFSGK
jgi:hypothetical protein